ncbi:type II toxin-antitoxin system RelE/ParE family toxin [Neptunicella sp.]|uniref:type II toxin-antitoxin system RelE/ParE family toxin n=1 Tax=Neptunicella sp. TaxID=2125986 RepID=UPI003F68F9B4
MPSSKALRISTPAEQDLAKIANYTLEQWGNAQQQHYLSKLQQALWLLCSEPEVGNSRDDILPGVCVYTVGKYRVLYRVTAQHLVILRVLHQSMLVQRHLPNDD